MSNAGIAGPRLCALLGDPVHHSLSPLLHNAAFAHEGLNAVYAALRVTAPNLHGLLRGLTDAGAAGNVTLPHKQSVANALDHATPAVKRTGACNTFWVDDGRLAGDNTDVIGFTRAAGELVGGSLRSMRVLVLGAGGAARAVVAALSEAGADSAVIVNRSPLRARQLAEVFAADSLQLTAVDRDRLPALGGFDLAVNATSLGLSPGDPLPLEIGEAPPFRFAMDLVYSRDETRWVHGLRECGVTAADGGEMLLQQAAAAYARWWGRDAPLAVMRDALRQARC